MVTLAYLLIALTFAFIVSHVVRYWVAGWYPLLCPLNAFFGGAIVVYVVQPMQWGLQFVEWYSESTYALTAFMVLIAMLFVAIGHSSAVGLSLAKKLPSMPERLVPHKMRRCGYIYVALGIVGYMYMAAGVGGMENWVNSRGATNWKTALIYIASLSSLLPAGVWVLMIENEMHGSRNLRRVVLLGIALLFLVWFFYLGSRSRTIGWTISLVGVYYLPRRKNPPWFLVAPLFLILLVTASFLGQYRDKFKNGSFCFEEIDWQEAAEHSIPFYDAYDRRASLEINRIDRGAEYSCVMTVLDLVPDKVQYNYGYCLLEFVTRTVPRAIWPKKIYPHYQAFTPIYEKGRLSSHVVATSYERILAGPAFTFVGHWYAVGGIVGIVIASTLTGIMFRTIAGIYVRNPGNEGDLVLYSSIYLIAIGEAIATPLFFIFSLPYGLMPLLVVLYVSRSRNMVRRAVKTARTVRSPSILRPKEE